MLRALPGTRFAQKVLLTVTVVPLRRGPKHLESASSRANKSSSHQICPTHTYLPATTPLPVSLLPLWLLASVPPLDPVSSSGFLSLSLSYRWGFRTSSQGPSPPTVPPAESPLTTRDALDPTVWFHSPFCPPHHPSHPDRKSVV